MKIKKGDTVKVLLGKDRDKTGKVLRIFTKENQVLVEGVNVYKRHVKKMGKKEGGIIDLTKPMDISNVVFICPNCQKSTRLASKIEGKTKLRICRECQEVIK